MLEKYVVVDLEMTGVQVRIDSVIEIGAVKVTPDCVEYFQKLLKPRTPIPEYIEELTGITNDMVNEQGEDADEAMRAFFEFAEDLPLVGHMISCDYAFLKQWNINKGYKYDRLGVDTLKLSRQFLPELEKRTLDYLVEYYDIYRVTNHRALEDAKATNILYRCLCTEFEEEKFENAFRAKEMQYQAKKQTPATKRQQEYLKKLVKFHGIEMPEGYEAFTRSEMSRVTDRLLSQYGKMDKEETQDA